jgi:FkbM family methyltransferase
MTLMRWFRDFRFRLFYSLITRKRPNLVTLGEQCPWTIYPDGLGPASHVLCAGAGNDISFEKALIASYESPVVLVDPSPTGIETVRRENLSAKHLQFLPVGLAETDGPVAFREPLDPGEGSFAGIGDAGSPTYTFQCQTLSTLMRQLDWNHIDLLKIDIEGSEYGVIRELLKKSIKVRQICVEFHHGANFGHDRNETVATIWSLRKAGYDLIHRTTWDHTFLRRDV